MLTISLDLVVSPHGETWQTDETLGVPRSMVESTKPTPSHHVGCSMTTSRKDFDEQPPTKPRWPDAAESIKFIDHLLETSDQSDDTSDWETLKALLAQDRPSGRKLFPDK